MATDQEAHRFIQDMIPLDPNLQPGATAVGGSRQEASQNMDMESMEDVGSRAQTVHRQRRDSCAAVGPHTRACHGGQTRITAEHSTHTINQQQSSAAAPPPQPSLQAPPDAEKQRHQLQGQYGQQEEHAQQGQHGHQRGQGQAKHGLLQGQAEATWDVGLGGARPATAHMTGIKVLKSLPPVAVHEMGPGGPYSTHTVAPLHPDIYGTRDMERVHKVAGGA